MITIRLLGGAKKALGKPSINIDKSSASVSEILSLLHGISIEPRLMDPNNLIVAINGVDSASIQGKDTIAKSGDTVTIVTVVHGGGTDFIIDDVYVTIIGVSHIELDPAKIIDSLRTANKSISIQAVNADIVYGVNHLLDVIRIALEAEKRQIMLANKIETEILMRLACTDQISEAMKRAGLKKDIPGCFIALSKDVDQLHRFAHNIQTNFDIDDSVLKSDKEKRVRLSNMLDLNINFDKDEFTNHLTERAAILVK